MNEIHSTAWVSPSASLSDHVKIGAWSIVEDGAVLSPGCEIHHRVTIGAGVVLGAGTKVFDGAIIHSGTELGEQNSVHEGAVVGGAPLMRTTTAACGKLRIGSRNTIRELATIQRASDIRGYTIIGDDNYIMPSTQIGHDSTVGDRVTLSNYTALAGHVTVQNGVVLGLGAVVHQYCRIGAFAMIGAAAYVSQDIAPYMLVDGRSGGIVGLNLVGLKRNGFDANAIAELKQAYRIVFRQNLPWTEILFRLENDFSSPAIDLLREFLASTRRGMARSRSASVHEPNSGDILTFRKAA